MNKTNYNIEYFLTENTPDQRDLSKLSFCNSTKVSCVQDWLNDLRVSQAHETSEQLYLSLPEIKRLKADKKVRFDILELVRPITIDCINVLSQEFLNQTIVLDEKKQKTAIVTQALEKYLVDAYMVCISDACTGSKLKPSKLNNASTDILSISLHRAMTGISFFMLRNFQLYTRPPNVFWQKLHGFYHIALFYGLERKLIKDEKNPFKTASTVHDIYSQCLLLGACRSNQLSQTGIESAFKLFADIGRALKLVEENNDNIHMHFVNPDQAIGPQYIELTDTPEDIGTNYFLDMQELLSKLKNDSLTSNNLISTNLFSQVKEHLISIWGAKPERYNKRLTIKDQTLEVSVGLSCAHYFSANKIDFNQFLSSGARNEPKDQHFIDAFTPNNRSSGNEDGAIVETFQVNVVDKSPKGYCISWKGDIPSQIESGQILSIRENSAQPMSICVIRWIKQLKSSSKMGIQVLSEQAQAVGVSQLYDMGGYSDPVRGLIIHDESITNLLSANAPLKPQSKVKIFDGQNTQRAFIEDCALATSKLRLFNFNYVKSDDAENDTTNSGSRDVDS